MLAQGSAINSTSAANCSMEICGLTVFPCLARGRIGAKQMRPERSLAPDASEMEDAVMAVKLGWGLRLYDARHGQCQGDE